MDIMQLSPVGKDYLWGGTKLKSEYAKEMDMYPLAETWECAVHPDGTSLVISGMHKGQRLDSVLQAHPSYLGKYQPDQFPILVKLIDAEQDLSVQVHPDDAFAAIHEQQNGKTEMWYVLEADENACLIYGFSHTLTKEETAQAIAEHALMQHLQKVPVHKGDVFFIPAGTVHAIGKGTVIAEIQENSNITYRIYDYDRKDKNGNPRELHIDKALQVMQTAPVAVPDFNRKLCSCDGYDIELLCKCDYFQTEKIRVRQKFDFAVLEDTFQVLLCIQGDGVLAHQQEKVFIRKGDCVFLPAGLGQCNVLGSVELLKIKC